MEDLSKTQGVTDQIACHALGLSEHFPRALLHGPVSLGGIGVSTLWADALAENILCTTCELGMMSVGNYRCLRG